MQIGVVIPTRGRPGCLDVALRSVREHAADADVAVVDDGPDPGTEAVARQHGARYVSRFPGRGVNAARNAGLGAAGDAELICLLDDDVRVDPGWLAALMRASAEAPDDVGAFTGPIRAAFEGHRFHACGRESPPITAQDFGPLDRDVPHAWGANLAVTRRALDAVGPFDASRSGAGDEEEWERRLLAAGMKIRYVAQAGVEHRRAGDDARLRALCAVARRRGREARAFDVERGTAPAVRAEARTLALTALHGPRLLCMNGPVMAAHSLGRLEEALMPSPPPAQAGVDDFLSGQSGTFGGWNGRVRGLADAALDARDARRRRQLAAGSDRRRVLVLAVDRPGSRFARAAAELERSRHDVTVATTGVGGRGKFENLNALLDEHPPEGFDWLLLVDDDVDLPSRFLDAFLAAAAPYALAQPAHRLRSHAAWRHTRRHARGPAARATTFVEIGPVTAFRRDVFATLLPFPPELTMGWGLDAHWSAVARERGWPLGIVDATPIGHTQAPAADAYSREQAVEEARAFLRGKPYVTRAEAR